MENKIRNIHTAARRYCIEKHSYWMSKYHNELVKTGKDRDEEHYTKEAYQIFPRYSVLSAIQTEVERLVPEDFSTIEEARQIITLAGESANSPFTQFSNQIAIAVMDEERKQFMAFIVNLTDDEINLVKPLPYRRVLDLKERQTLWIKLKQVLLDDFTTLWETEKIIPFREQYFLDEFGIKNVQTILIEHGLSRVWELCESREEPEYEVDPCAIEVCYNGIDRYWFSNDMDWIIFSHHEGFIGFGGWVLNAVKDVWPTWKEGIWG